MHHITKLVRGIGTRSTASRGGQRAGRRTLRSSDPSLTNAIQESLTGQVHAKSQEKPPVDPMPEGNQKWAEEQEKWAKEQLEKAPQRALEMSGSFAPDTPVTVGKATGQEMLSTGSVDAPPSGTFLGDYDEYFSGGLPMRLPPETVKDRLALPSANKADTLYRAKTTPGADQFEGVAGPQGSPPTAVFREPRPGGGRQTVTPGGTFTGAVTDVEQIADKRDLKHGTWRDTQ